MGNFESCFSEVTSLLCRLQAQTLPNATQQIVKINHFSKVAVTNNVILISFKILNALNLCNRVFSMTGSTISDPLG